MAKAATSYGIAFAPFPLAGSGADAIGDLFVTNFTNVTQPWIMSVPIDLSALQGLSTAFFPCDSSQILHDEVNASGVCDIYLNGFQTLSGSPTVLLDVSQKYCANCCPMGVLRQATDDLCCVDDLSQNPFRLGYNGAVTAANMQTSVFSFNISKSATVFAVDPTYNISCASSEVDQLLLFIKPSIIPNVMFMTLDGQPLDFIVSSDAYTSWLRAINLNYALTGVSNLTLTVAGSMAVNQLCSTHIGSSLMCEYVLFGNYDASGGTYQCCPHGAANVMEGVCPAPSPLDKNNN